MRAMRNVLLVNPHSQVGYALANSIRPICNKLIAISDTNIPKIFCNSKLYDAHLRLSFPSESWNKGIISTDNSPAEELYITELIKICRDNAINIVFPEIDNDIYLLSKNKNKFKHYDIALMVPDYETYLKVSDKHHVVELAQQHNFPCVKSFLCSNQADIASAVHSLGFPLVIKQRFSVGTDNVRLAYNLEELQIYASNFMQVQPQVILQEYICGTQERSLNILITPKGHFPLAFTLKKVRHLRPSLSTAIEVVNNPSAEMTIAKKILSSLGCVGFFVFQTKIDSRDGKHKIVEINPRIGANYRILFRFGINIPEMLIKSLEDDNYQASVTIPVGATGVSVFEDILAFFTYLAYCVHYFRSPEKNTYNKPPGLFKFLKSYINTYSKKPFIDVYSKNIMKDTKMVFGYYAYILKSLKQQGVKRLRFIPWGDI